MHGICQGRTYGPVTVGERGQLVVPAELRKALGIKTGDQLMVFAKLEKRMISLMPFGDFSKFLARAAKIISRLEKKVPKKR